MENEITNIHETSTLAEESAYKAGVKEGIIECESVIRSALDLILEKVNPGKK